MIADQNQMIVLHTKAEVPTINRREGQTDLHVNLKENPNQVKEPNVHVRLKAEKEPDQEDQIPIVSRTAGCRHPKWMEPESYV